MTPLTILSHPICYMILVFLFTMGAFEYGGDRVLIDCAHTMQNIFRATDYIGRLGGDEFMAFTENLTDTAMIKERASTLCNNLSLMIKEDGKSVQIGCSIGIVTNIQNSDFTKIYNCADKALYSAKTDGKGQFKLISIE